MSFFQLPPLIGGIIFSLGAAIFALFLYSILRRLLAPYISNDTQNLSNSTIVRVGTLYALILALVFAQEFENYMGVNDTTNNEAEAIGIVYYGLSKFNSQTTEEIQRTIVRYVQTVIEEEWRLLSQKKLSEKAWNYYRNVKMGIMSLEPKNLLQKDLRSQFIRDWDSVGRSRIAREVAASNEIPSFFVVLCVVGFLLVMVPYFAFSPKFSNLFLIAVHAAFNGLIIYLILAIANPFSLSLAVEPTVLDTLMNEYIINVPAG